MQPTNPLTPSQEAIKTLKNTKNDPGRPYDGMPSLHVWLHVWLRWKTPNMQSNMQPTKLLKPAQEAIKTLKNRKHDPGRPDDGIPSLHVRLHVWLRWKTPNMQSNMQPTKPLKPAQETIKMLTNRKNDPGRPYHGIPSLHVWLHVLLRWKTPNMQSNMRPIGPSKPGQDAIRTPQHLNIWCLRTYIRAYIRTYIQVQNLCGGSPLAKVDHNVHTYKYKICVRSPLAKVDHTYI